MFADVGLGEQEVTTLAGVQANVVRDDNPDPRLSLTVKTVVQPVVQMSRLGSIAPSGVTLIWARSGLAAIAPAANNERTARMVALRTRASMKRVEPS